MPEHGVILLAILLNLPQKKHNEIRITGRTRHYLSLCGEHLSVDNMNRAVEMMCNKLNITVKEFTVSGIKHGSMFAHKWFLGTDDELDSEVAKELIDSNLKILNDDYRVERIEAIKKCVCRSITYKNLLSMDARTWQRGGGAK